MKRHPIFEDSVSTLYYSNDTRLHIILVQGTPDERAYWAVVYIHDKDPVPDLDDPTLPVVFATYDRVKADAFISGYDFYAHY